MSDEYTEYELKKLQAVKDAMDNMEGILIPYNITKQNIRPFAAWLDEVIKEQPND